MMFRSHGMAVLTPLCDPAAYPYTGYPVHLDPGTPALHLLPVQGGPSGGYRVASDWARLTTWWASRAPPRPPAWHLQRACRNTTRRIAAHSSREAAGRPVARGPPRWIRRRATAPTRTLFRSDRLSISAARGFAHVGKIH
jgi:hypothetical protein